MPGQAKPFVSFLEAIQPPTSLYKSDAVNDDTVRCLIRALVRSFYPIKPLDKVTQEQVINALLVKHLEGTTPAAFEAALERNNIDAATVSRAARYGVEMSRLYIEGGRTKGQTFTDTLLHLLEVVDVMAEAEHPLVFESEVYRLYDSVEALIPRSVPGLLVERFKMTDISGQIAELERKLKDATVDAERLVTDLTTMLDLGIENQVVPILPRGFTGDVNACLKLQRGLRKALREVEDVVSSYRAAEALAEGDTREQLSPVVGRRMDSSKVPFGASKVKL